MIVLIPHSFVQLIFCRNFQFWRCKVLFQKTANVPGILTDASSSDHRLRSDGIKKLQALVTDGSLNKTDMKALLVAMEGVCLRTAC